VNLAMPPPADRALLRPGFPQLPEAISDIPRVSTATVSLAYRDAKPSVALDGTGFVIARGESRRILACTWSSQKFSGRAPAGSLLVRCFLGGEGGEEPLRRSDDELGQIARSELEQLMGLHGAPLFSAVFRWEKANPILEVGHAGRLRRIEKALEASRRLFVTGAGFRGIGIPDCVRDAKNVAAQVAVRL